MSIRIDIIGVLLALWAATSSWCDAGQTLQQDNFQGTPDGTSLEAIEGWERHYGSGESPAVVTVAGYEGNGIRFYDKIRMSRSLPSSAAEVFTFRMKFRVMSVVDSYTIFNILLGSDEGQNAGVSGLCLQLNGGDTDGPRDNIVRVSTGGKNMGSIEFQSLPDVQWKKGIWYELVIAGIRPQDTAMGDVVGYLSLREVSNGNVLLKNAPLGRIGSTNHFNQVNEVVMGNIGAKREVDVDDISFSIQ